MDWFDSSRLLESLAGGCKSLEEKVRLLLFYVWLGFPVVRLHSVINGECTCGDPECRSAGKHPVHSGGYKNAGTDEDSIWANLADWQYCNIGIATGEAGLVVFDVDPRHGGDSSWDELEQEFGANHLKTVTIRTGGGGYHHYFAAPPGVSLRSKTSWRPGIDIRAHGGLVVAPGSVHSAGNLYVLEMADSEDPEVAMEPSPLPSCLLQALRSDRVTEKDEEEGEEEFDGTDEQVPSDTLLRRALDTSYGQRNDRGFWLACQLRDNGYSKREARDVLLDYHGQVPDGDEPYEEKEALNSIEQAYSRPPRKPWKRASRPSIAPISWSHEPKTAFATSALTLDTDKGNAKRLIHRFGRDLHCVNKQWWVWDGKRWKEDRRQQVIRMAMETIEGLLDGLKSIKDKEDREKLFKFVVKSENVNRLNAMVDLARALPGVSIETEDFDSDPWTFNCLNGTLDLMSMELRPHRREDLLTKLAPVEYDANAQCPQWESFLERILPDPEVRSFVQRATGYSLTGSVKEQCLLFFHGSGANGKSTFLQTVQEMMGDYSRTVSAEILLASQNGNNERAAVPLLGARLVSTIEVEDGRKMASAWVKQLTGGDRLTMRRLWQEVVEFEPTFKLFLAANHKPDIKDTTRSIWRRIHRVPFEISIPEAEQDKNLPEKLRTELPGILAWAVRGCAEWRERGLNVPEVVRSATEEYRTEMDVLANYIGERCEVDTNHSIPLKDLFADYKNWCEAAGERYGNNKSFSAALREKGFHSERKGRGVLFYGLRLAPESPLKKEDVNLM